MKPRPVVISREKFQEFGHEVGPAQPGDQPPITTLI